MKLTLSRADLRDEHLGVNCSLTKFEHFNDDAQRAMQAMPKRKATFREYDDSNFNIIRAPEQKPWLTPDMIHVENIDDIDRLEEAQNAGNAGFLAD